MVRWLLVLCLVMAPAIAWAQPSTVPTARATTLEAQDAAALAERRVVQLAVRRGPLAARYEGELAAIDRLKQKKKTWNLERELKNKLSAANETAMQLQNLDRALAAAQAQLASARRVLVVAIDAELVESAGTPRAVALQQLRGQLVPQVKRTAHRIAIPNLEVDLRADPEDLDAQAAALRHIEAELARQIAGLDKQSKDLERVAELRRSHDRTIALDRRDDNTPSRNAPQDRSNGRAFSDSESAPHSGDGATPPNPLTHMPLDMGFEVEARVVLQDVVDPSTIDILTSAQHSGDPAKRSKAAAKTRDDVKAKLELLRQKRAQIEQRAKQLRK